MHDRYTFHEKFSFSVACLCMVIFKLLCNFETKIKCVYQIYYLEQNQNIQQLRTCKAVCSSIPFYNPKKMYDLKLTLN